jgi:hypothetical protein
MNAYCDRQSVEFNSIAFLFDGRRLRAEQTPDEVSISLYACVFVDCLHAIVWGPNLKLYIFLAAAGNGGWR